MLFGSAKGPFVDYSLRGGHIGTCNSMLFGEVSPTTFEVDKITSAANLLSKPSRACKLTQKPPKFPVIVDILAQTITEPQVSPFKKDYNLSAPPWVFHVSL